MVLRGKDIDTSVAAELASNSYVGVYLARLECDTPTGFLRYSTAFQNIYWDDLGGGEEAYLGTGLLAAIQPLTETGELGAIQVAITLAGLPAQGQLETPNGMESIIKTSFSRDYRLKPAYIYYAVLDTDTYSVIGEPILIFTGLMDQMHINIEGTMAITLTMTARLADWERTRGGRYNHHYQRRYVDPTDTAFKFVEGLADRELMWGGKSIADPGDHDTGGVYASPPNHGGDTGGERCFAKDTQILMANGFYKNIQDINLNDTIFLGGKVKGVLHLDSSKEEWYISKNTIVSGSQLILEKGTWELIHNKPHIKKSHIIPESCYDLITESHVLVTKDGQIFADYQDGLEKTNIPDGLLLNTLNSKINFNKNLEGFVNAYLSAA